MELKSFIQKIHPLSPLLLDELVASFQHFEFPKNYYLLKQGRTCHQLWFLVKGAVRYFYTDGEGKEVNVWFSFEPDILADTPSLIQQTPALESIQLLEDSSVYAIDYAVLQRLLQQHHALALWYIKLFETYYVPQMEDRVSDLQFLNARQRYEKLLGQFPDITNRISLGHIASYLNISQETLSRIRSGKQ
ncbi:Crp/Fnr family transcriptional regulator [Haliscomenobacter sp.]|uniref:Crp/Fnr family transcriptional regulator n=1 Tax=Haliscomenobacter sp. TaxID=2717303 RepID=UPI00359393FB